MCIFLLATFVHISKNRDVHLAICEPSRRIVHISRNRDVDAMLDAFPETGTWMQCWLSTFPETTLQDEGDDDVDVMLFFLEIQTLSSAA